MYRRFLFYVGSSMLARDIEMLIEHCGLKGLSTKTINNYLRNLRVFFHWCVEEEPILRSPVKKGNFIKVERRPLEFVSDEDFKRLLL